MAKPARFSYTCEDGLHRYDFPDEKIPEVSITVETTGRNHLGQLWATVTARFKDTIAATSQFNLLDQNKRVDFEKIAATFDGQVHWHDLLLTLVPDLLQQLKSSSHDLTTTLEPLRNPWLKVKSVTTWLEEIDPEFLGLAKDLVAPGVSPSLPPREVLAKARWHMPSP